MSLILVRKDLEYRTLQMIFRMMIRVIRQKNPTLTYLIDIPKQ